MSDNRKPVRDLSQTSGFIANLLQQGRLAWRLFRDRRVPGWVKLVPVAGFAYLLSPIDLLPDFLLPGLGGLDDLSAILLSLKVFVDLSPPDVVNEHLRNLVGRVRAGQAPSDAYIEVPYHVLDEEDRAKEPLDD